MVFHPVTTMNSNNKLNTFSEIMTNAESITLSSVKTTMLPYKPSHSQFACQIAAQSLSLADPESLSLINASILKPNEVVAFKRPDVQDDVFRNLRLGKNEVHARLDLHKFTLKEARNEFLMFLRQCQRLDFRTIIIVHGKDERTMPFASIKSFVCQWLEQIEDVKCFHSAQRHQGGTGAVYVLLKKSHNKKFESHV